MAQNIALLGASYNNVPSITVPKQGGGTASFTDVTDTTATASDVASGKSIHLSNGNLATGTMPDYTTFATYMIESFNYTVTTQSSNSYSFPLPACDLSGRPVKWIQIYSNIGTVSTTSTSTQNSYITGFSYSADSLLKINSNGKIIGMSSRVGKSNSTTATSNSTVYGASYFSLQNIGSLATGGASIKIDSSKAGALYFKGNTTYYVMIGG